MRFIRHTVVGSTQDEARALYRSGERGPLWVSADSQTAGRGRLSRAWQSPSGNLSATLLYPTEAEPSEAALYGFAVAVALADAVNAYRPSAPVTLKWPNDVLLGGAKLAGILVEREAEALLVGVGVNLVSHPNSLPYPATHLVAHMRADDLASEEPLFTGAQAALALLSRHVMQRFAQLERDGFEPVRSAWTARAHGLGTRLSAGGQVGTFTGIATTGALCLRLEGGKETRVHAGDVSFG